MIVMTRAEIEGLMGAGFSFSQKEDHALAIELAEKAAAAAEKKIKEKLCERCLCRLEHPPGCQCTNEDDAL